MARRPIAPIRWQDKISEQDGTPTPFFQRWCESLLRATGLLGDIEENQLGLEQRVENNEDAIDDISAREVVAGDELEGGGFLGGPGDIEIDHSQSGVTPDTYGNSTNVPQITVNAFGHVTEVVDVPISGGGGSLAWELVDSWTHSTNVTSVPFTDLGDYTEIMIICLEVTLQNNTQRIIQLSSDNGSTYDTTNANYPFISADGTVNTPNIGGFFPHDTNATAARSFIAFLENFNQPTKTIFRNETRDRRDYHVGNTAWDALRVIPATGGNITGGSIEVYGRR